MTRRNAMPTKPKTNRSAAKRNRGLSRLRKPEDMSLEDWQVALRRDFGRTQKLPPEEPGRRAALLGVRGHQSRDEADLSGGDPRRRRWARTTAPAPTSPSTRWAPASTSSSSWAGWGAGRGPRRPWPWAISRRTRKSICSTGRGGRWCSGRARSVRRRCGPWPGGSSTPNAGSSPRPSSASTRFLQKAQSNGHEFRCYNDALEYIAQVRDQAAPGRAGGGGLSAGNPRRRPGTSCSRSRSIRTSAKGPCSPPRPAAA